MTHHYFFELLLLIMEYKKLSCLQLQYRPSRIVRLISEIEIEHAKLTDHPVSLSQYKAQTVGSNLQTQ